MNHIPVIYVAGPFRGDNAWEIEQNIRRAEEDALEIWRAGGAALCPHCNTRFFQGAAPDEVWLDGDLALLAKCDAIYLLQSWKRSFGARAERDYAVKLGIPVLECRFDMRRWITLWKESKRLDEVRADGSVYP